MKSNPVLPKQFQPVQNNSHILTESIYSMAKKNRLIQQFSTGRPKRKIIYVARYLFSRTQNKYGGVWATTDFSYIPM